MPTRVLVLGALAAALLAGLAFFLARSPAPPARTSTPDAAPVVVVRPDAISTIDAGTHDSGSGAVDSRLSTVDSGTDRRSSNHGRVRDESTEGLVRGVLDPLLTEHREVTLVSSTCDATGWCRVELEAATLEAAAPALERMQEPGTGFPDVAAHMTLEAPVQLADNGPYRIAFQLEGVGLPDAGLAP